MTPNLTSELQGEQIQEEGYKPEPYIREILFEGYFYDVTNWIEKHPGGRIIEFYTNKSEDATEAINQFHYRTMSNVKAKMKSFRKRKADLSELQLTSQTVTKNKVMTEDFAKLYNEIKAEGLFQPSYVHNLIRIVEILLMGFLGYHIFFYQSWFLKIFGVLLMGLAHGRSGWLQHEFGHNSITGNPKWDKWGQALFFGVGLGLSAKGWQIRHNRHHAMPNRVDHDMDIHLLPIIAMSVKTFKDPKKESNWVIKHQAWLFPFVEYVYVLSQQLYYMPRCSLRNRKYFELFAYAIHYALAYYIGFTVYFFGVNYISSFYLMTNFALSHTHLPVAMEPTHWLEYGLNYTCNVHPSWWCDWFMGYLNFQIEHHLFPNIPQFRLHRIMKRVKALAKKHGLPYHVMSYKNAILRTLVHHWDVSQQLKSL